MASVSASPPAANAPAIESTADAKADRRSSSALASAKRNFAYLYDPKSKAHAPAKLRTRALLRSLRYIGIFIFWRIVRYAKYALVGSVVAAVGATAFGGAISGAAFLLAPPTTATSVSIGMAWAVGKWGFKKSGLGKRLEKGAIDEVAESRRKITTDGTWGDVQGPEAAAW